jgi:general secretion pathway protein A
MYCEFYNLTEKPFTLTPNPDFIFLSKNHKEAFAHLLYGIDHHVGFIELTGEVGTGKTTVIRTLLGQLSPDLYRSALIFNPCISALNLMQTINREYGMAWERLTDAELLDSLNGFLLEQNMAGRTVVLVIDEAQNLTPEVLEQIRLISNLETKNDKLIQIVLVGQSELKTLLEKSELRQLNQRITVRYHLWPMDFDDTRDYIQHRLKVAGAGDYPQFQEKALKKIYRFSGGLPRLINAVCDRALLLGYTSESRVITTDMIQSAVQDIRNPEKLTFSIPGAVFTVAALAVLFGIVGVISLNQPAAKIPAAAASAPPAVQNAAPAKPAEPAPVNPLQAVQKELAKSSESENTAMALNALLKMWKVEPLSPKDLPEGGPDLDKIVRQRDLRLAQMTGNLGTLLRFDMPVLLELFLPGVEGKRYLAVTGFEAGRILIAPSVAGRTWMTGMEMDALWGGKMYFLWKNHYDIPTRLKQGSQRKEIVHLQRLLRKVGFYKGPRNGIYDKATMEAVRSFQVSQGLLPERTMGRKTLVFLYREAGLYPPPRLSKKAEGKAG